MTDANRFGGGRVGRASKLSGLAAGHVARSVGTKVAATGRSEDAKREARRRQQLATADRVVEVLGSMKGAAMKLGQTLSVVDIGIVDPEFREEFQAKLAVLQNQAKAVAFRDMRKVIERDLGMALDEAFSSFDETPIAAASIGQVYRATLVDGRAVAVKVQYPGIEQSIRADLKNLDVMLKVLARVAAGGIDVDGMAREIQDRFTEELDYVLEAANQKAMARAFRGHPFFVVPDVVTELCGDRVLVTEFIEGRAFADVLKADEPTRRDYAEVLFRFYVNAPLRTRLLNGDPHPGNALLLDDGRVAFLDFGFFQHLSRAERDEVAALLRAMSEDDHDAVRRLVTQVGMVSDEVASIEPILALVRSSCAWFLDDGEVNVGTGITADTAAQLGAATQAG